MPLNNENQQCNGLVESNEDSEKLTKELQRIYTELARSQQPLPDTFHQILLQHWWDLI